VGIEHTWVEVAVHSSCQRVVPQACPREGVEMLCVEASIDLYQPAAIGNMAARKRDNQQYVVMHREIIISLSAGRENAK
jgi:hypothetical protein